MELICKVLNKRNYKYIFNGRSRGPYSSSSSLNIVTSCVYGLLSLWGIVFVIMHFREYNSFLMNINKYFVLVEVTIYGTYILIALSCSPCLVCVIRNKMHSSSEDIDIADTLSNTFNIQEKGYTHIKSIVFGTNFVDKEETMECKICYVNHSNTKILPCSHNTYCSACINHVNRCPTCRGTINSIKVYKKVAFN